MKPYRADGPELVLGETDYRAGHRRFGLHATDRLRHAWLIGKTGSGKSTLVANLVRQDLAHGRGCAVIDPHGDLIDALLPFVPPPRRDSVLLFAPDDRDWPVSFNVFRAGRSPHADSALLAAQLVAVFKKQWAEFFGPRMEHILRNAILAVAPDPRATLLFLYRFLTDKALRERVVAEVRDPVVRHFWTREFAAYSASFRGEAFSPVLNKLGAFVSNPIVRAIVGQERSRVDLRRIMDTRGILFAKLPVGTIGEDASRLLGGLLLTALQLSAMERPRGGPTFTAYVDEFQHFVTDSVATLLSESRKFGLALVLAHQYLSQLPLAVRDAVLGNVGTLIAFRLGGADAKELEVELGPELAADDLQHLEPYHFAVRMLAEGKALRPFTARTLPPPAPPRDAEEIARRIRDASRARHARPRADVDSAIASSLGAGA